MVSRVASRRAIEPMGTGEEDGVFGSQKWTQTRELRRMKMSKRFVTAMSLLSVMIAVSVLLPVPIAGREQPGVATTGGETFRTPWGDPDLQGVWDGLDANPVGTTREIRRQAALHGGGSHCIRTTSRSS